MQNSDDKNGLAWLELWARLATTPEPTPPSRTGRHLEMTKVIAAAGSLRHHQAQPANDPSLASLITLLHLVWLCAIYSANLIILRSDPRKIPHASVSALIARNPSSHAPSSLATLVA